jgi:hypothetical protein
VCGTSETIAGCGASAVAHLHALGNVAIDDTLRQPFSNGSLTHARRSYQDWVALCAA